jgi:FkbM family methyltransferase
MFRDPWLEYESYPMRLEPYRWRLSSSWLAHLYKAVARQHHKELVPILRPLLAPDAVIFDVGAHAGQFAKLFAHLAPAGRVWSFEPGSYARSILRLSLWLNRIGNVTIVPMGLGETCAIGTLALPIKRPGVFGFGLAHLGQSEERWTHVAVEPIALGTIDRFVETQGIIQVDFIKADIEGWEGAMLRGGFEVLRRLRPVLLLELNETHLNRAGDTLSGVFAMLRDLGYRPYVPDGIGRLTPLDSISGGDVWWLPQERSE